MLALILVIGVCVQVEFKHGAYVFRKGDPGTDFYIVSQGTALVKDGSKVGTHVVNSLRIHEI